MFLELSLGYFYIFQKDSFNKMAFNKQFEKFLREKGVTVPEEEVEAEKKETMEEDLPSKYSSSSYLGINLDHYIKFTPEIKKSR